MKTRNAAVAAALLVASLAGTADADVIIDVSQSGSNVVATGSGSIDLTGLAFNETLSVVVGVQPNIAFITLGATPGGSFDIYTGASGPSSFGSGGTTLADSGTGPLFGVLGTSNVGTGIFVPIGYVSGNPLSGSLTFDNKTIAGLGLTPGTYTYTWGTGPVESLTVNISPASVPEPSSLALAGMAVAAGLIAACRRRP